MAVPVAPTNVVATWISDYQINVAWTSNETTDAPYTTYDLQRWWEVKQSWATIATGLVSASYSDKTTASNQAYRYRVYVANTDGNATSTATPLIYTTPLAPTSHDAAKNVSDIVLTWAAVQTQHEDGFALQASQSGGAYASLATVAADIVTYTHVAPSVSVTWTYQVRATAGERASAWVTSNTVALLAAPLAPTGLTIASVIVAAEANTLSWTHNAVDTSGQAAYQIRYRIIGASAWTEETAVTSNTSAHTFPAAFFVNGNDYEVQVRTKGQHVDYSPYSGSKTFRASARPTATINSPTNASTVTAPSVTIVWGYYDAESTVQTARKVVIYASDGTTVLYSNAVADAATSATPVYVLQDGTSYVLAVLVRDGDGLWSAENSVTVAVDYVEPTVPTLNVTYDVDTGSALVGASNPEEYWYKIADNGPVADWRSVLRNNKYYDPISKTWASVTRATVKTIYDPLDGVIRNVPVDYLAMNPWKVYKDAGVGCAAAIEEARTNLYGAQSSITTQAVLDGWTADAGLTATLLGSAHGVYGGSIGASLAAAGGTYALWKSVGTITAASRYISAHVWLASGAAPVATDCQLCAAAGTGTPVATLLTTTFTAVTGCLVGDKQVYLAEATYAGTAAAWTTGIAVKDGITVYFDLAQDELGAFRTSFTTGVRDADVLAPSLTTLPVGEGTIVCVASDDAGAAVKPYVYITYSDGSSVKLAIDNLTPAGTVGATGSATAGNVVAATARVVAMTWKANELIVYKDGVAGTADTTVTAPTGTVTGAFIGSDGSLYSNAAQHRVVFYDSALSAATLATAAMTTELLAGTEDELRPAVVSNSLYRVIDGITALVAGSVPPNGACTDYLPLACGTTGYYVVAYSALPSASTSATVDLVTTGSGGWIYLNGGAGLGDVVTMRYGPAWQEAPERERVLHQFSGQASPVEFSSSAKPRTVNVAAYIYDAGMRDALILMAEMAGPHFLRDSKGRHMRCSLSGVSVAESFTRRIPVSFVATRTQP